MLEVKKGHSINYFYVAVVFVILILGIDLAFTLLVTNQQQRNIFADVLSPIVDLLASVTLFIAARRSATRTKRLAIAWGMICLSMLSFMAGDTVWGILEVVLKEQPFPSLADGFYLAYYPFLLVGVLLLPSKTVSIGEHVNKFLDIGIVMVAAILGFWNFLLGPIILANTGLPWIELAILLAYPVGDLVLLWALHLIINNGSDEVDELSAFLLGGGLLITIISDSIYSYQVLIGTYTSGGILDIGWIASVLLVGLAGMAQLSVVSNTGRTAISYKSLDRAKVIRPYLPYFWLIPAYILLIKGEQTTLPMSFLLLSLGVAGIIGLVLIRQIITLSQNNKLNVKLQETMNSLRYQAGELEKANLELIAEIMERKRIEEKLSYDTLHDAMTGLANRVLFVDRLGQAIEYTKRRAEYSFAVLFIDIDQFKVINDSLGHLKGDQLLVSVARRLRECLRTSDTVARFGGDEFAILLEITGNRNSAPDIARKIQEVLKSPFTLEGQGVYITTSIGIVMGLIGYEHPDDVLRDVDIAMYQAKALGKARFEIFDIEMRNQAFSRLVLENELRAGLENREFQLFYQPIVDLESNRIISFEALIRWLHPRLGLLLPDKFLSIAEESGLILPIGAWVLNEACSQLKKWHQKYPSLQNVSINVNISNRQFSQPHFVEEVVETLIASGLQSKSLKLEITENILISNYAAANKIFTQLRNLGIQLQIDDFGSGYSALGYLQHFPISTIKIDKTFIDEIGKGHRSIELIRAIVSMARELGMETIAEGIETGEQLDTLKSLSCSIGQGFHLSKPLDKDSVEKMLAKKGGD